MEQVKETLEQPAKTVLSFEERSKKAAGNFLERRGYEILETNWEGEAGTMDFICEDDENLVFVKVYASSIESKGFPESSIPDGDLKTFEMMAAEYLKKNPCTETIIRFDVISVLVVAEDRAFLRHHLGAHSQ